MPIGAAWWLEHGQPLSIGQAEALGMTAKDAWLASNLHYARLVATGWTRADLRELGYGPMIDAHVAADRCPADGWRYPPSAEVVRLGELSAKNRGSGQ